MKPPRPTRDGFIPYASFHAVTHKLKARIAELGVVLFGADRQHPGAGALLLPLRREWPRHSIHGGRWPRAGKRMAAPLCPRGAQGAFGHGRHQMCQAPPQGRSRALPLESGPSVSPHERGERG
jgi:hypothetical protein